MSGVNHCNVQRRTMQGLTACITGASSGIGEAIAREIHRRGASVVLIARRAELLRKLAGELELVRPGSTEVLEADLTTTEGLERSVTRVRDGRVDILVNNAGRGSFGYFETLPPEKELELVRLNINASMMLAHAVIPQLKARRSGGIISLASIAAFQPIPYMSTYAATKSFNLIHSMGLHRELAPFNVHVSTVCPGPVATEFGGVARVPGEFTSVGRDSAVMVARAAVDGFVSRRAVIVPGVRAKFMSLPARVLPYTWTAWLTEKLLVASLRAVSERPLEYRP
jgi:uncharacterized protein